MQTPMYFIGRPRIKLFSSTVRLPNMYKTCNFVFSVIIFASRFSNPDALFILSLVIFGSAYTNTDKSGGWGSKMNGANRGCRIFC
jgi:hypothetical protein